MSRTKEVDDLERSERSVGPDSCDCWEVRKANRLLVSIGILSRALVSGSRGVLLLLRVLALII